LRALHANWRTPAPVHRHSVSAPPESACGARFDLVENLVARPHDQLGGGRRRGSAQIGHESAIVKSVSWPIAEITGGSDAAMARATASSLKVHKSSSDPPPRATITTSAHPPRLKY